MRVVELFAGVGGFRLGLERAGHKVVWSNEWDKYAAQTYNKNFGGSIDQRDITKIRADEVPSHDLLVGGFPCQSFSIAGKRRGFDEVRGTLFFDIARIAAYHKTKYLLLENVKGLINHDGGHTFTTIIRALDELGYDCQWQVLNSKDFGVPQNRERVIIVGHLRGEPRPQVFPLGADTTTTAPFRTAGNDTGRNIGDGEDAHGWPTERRAVSQAIDANYYKGIDNHKQRTLVTQPRYRRLTPMECERLQGFPDGWTEGVSDTQRYKQMGNAVTVNVVEAVAKRLTISIYSWRSTRIINRTVENCL